MNKILKARSKYKKRQRKKLIREHFKKEEKKWKLNKGLIKTGGDKGIIYKHKKGEARGVMKKIEEDIEMQTKDLNTTNE